MTTPLISSQSLNISICSKFAITLCNILNRSMCSKFLFFTKLVVMGLNHTSDRHAEVIMPPITIILLFNRTATP
jgi:hypothetical protein